MKARERRAHRKHAQQCKKSIQRRVANGGQPRVSPAASTSANPTSPRVIAKTRFVNQRQIRNNIPYTTLFRSANEEILNHVCDTHGFVTAVAKIYPAHYRTPAISEDDLTIGAAAELIETMKGNSIGIKHHSPRSDLEARRWSS